jgi:tripartite-type tricarboxylate transporter receptor subunit TctC
MNKPVLLALATSALALAAGASFAQGYPSKPIRVVVPFPGGPSGVDQGLRVAQQKIAEFLGQPLVIDNRSGANGTIGSDYVAKSAPDGYTLLFTTPSTHITAVFLSKNLPYDPVKDFTPISAMLEPVTGLVANPDIPVSNIRELIDYAKRNPGKLSYASSGIGSVFHLTGELFKQVASIDLLHVPYKGTQQALTDTMSGANSLALSAVSGVMPLAKSGKLKLLAVLEAKRFSRLPDVPTIGESLPGFEKPASWFGFFGPAGLPPAIVSRVQADVARGANVPEVRDRLEEMGLVVIGSTSTEFAAILRRGYEVYGQAAKAAGVKPE